MGNRNSGGPPFYARSRSISMERIIMKLIKSSSVKGCHGCLTDVAVVPKLYAGSNHHLLRGRFPFTRRGEKAAKFSKWSPRTVFDWEPLASFVAFWEDTVMDNDDEYERLVRHLQDCTRKAKTKTKTNKRRLPL
ncbi:hypothetical protein RB195_010587 [Necator americanus]|uniref:Uncharacterized protein n=1 Tax=Necator americanus TaxID=51031 RepID=A0ABR1CYM3_NECAM